MKRTISLLLALLMLLALSACTGGDKPSPSAAPDATQQAENTGTSDTTAEPETTLSPGELQFTGDLSYDPETDFDPRFSGYQGNLFDIGDAFYWTEKDDGYMRYVMKDGSDWGVLCPKPECDHDSGNAASRNSGCLGYMTYGKRNTACGIYDGKIYYVDHYRPGEGNYGVIYRMNLDGSGHERVGTIPLIIDSNGNDVYPQYFEYHRGKIFIFACVNSVVNGEPMQRTAFVEVPLEGGEYKIMYECDAGTYGYIDMMGEFCYMFSMYRDEETDTIRFKLLRWSMVTEKLDELYDGDELYLFPNPGTLWMSGGNVYTKGDFDQLTGVKAVMYLKDGVWEELINFDDDGELSYSVEWISDGIAIAEQFDEVYWTRIPDDLDFDIWIKRFDGETLYKGKLPLDWAKSELIQPGYKIQDVNYAFGDENAIYYDFMLYNKRDREANVLVKYEITEEGLIPTVIGMNYSWSPYE